MTSEFYCNVNGVFERVTYETCAYPLIGCSIVDSQLILRNKKRNKLKLLC
jgi:hypothetical protein